MLCPSRLLHSLYQVLLWFSIEHQEGTSKEQLSLYLKRPSKHSVFSKRIICRVFCFNIVSGEWRREKKKNRVVVISGHCSYVTTVLYLHGYYVFVMKRSSVY